LVPEKEPYGWLTGAVGQSLVYLPLVLATGALRPTWSLLVAGLATFAVMFAVFQLARLGKLSLADGWLSRLPGLP
jgi:hypothetical protein